jgi:LysM repeat protein
MDCYYCDAQAVQECARCGALYCDDHGDALCQRCMDPMHALPSYRIYRGSLITLLVGTVFAVWLLVRPPGTDADGPVPSSISNVLATPAASATATPQGASAANPASTPSGQVAGPPATATPATAGTPPPLTHTVEAGDTLVGIAAKYLPAGKAVADFAIEIQQANGITDAATIRVGQSLRIPR